MGRRALALVVVSLLALVLDHPVEAAKAKRRRKKRDGGGGGGVPGGGGGGGSAAADPQAMQHHQRGVMAHVQGDVEGAKREFRAAIRSRPDFAYAYYRLGFVLQEEQERQRQRRAKRRGGDDGARGMAGDGAKGVAVGEGARPASGGQRARAAAESEGEEQPQDDELLHTRDPIALFRVAVGIDGRDEMVYHALGQALKDEGRLEEAGETYKSITTRVNPHSAQAYWGLGKVAAFTIDEFDSDPDDPNDPSHFYAIAARLRPSEYGLDGTRRRRVEPNTPEREAKVEADAKARRDNFLSDLQQGRQQMKFAGEPL